MISEKQPASDKSPSSLLALPDEGLFQDGGCHAFALELDYAFKQAGQEDSLIYYLPHIERPDIAIHVFLKTTAGYYDSRFGPQTPDEIKAHWPNHVKSLTRHVENYDWLEKPTDNTPEQSFLALCVNPCFLNQAKQRARAFIERNKSRFGLD